MSFERVCSLADVKEPGSLRVELADVDIAVVRFEGDVYAIEDQCSHAEVPLSEGDVEEFKGAPTIECWLHGSCFDLRTGEPTNLPATEPVAVYPVRVEGRTCTSTCRSTTASLPRPATEENECPSWRSATCTSPSGTVTTPRRSSAAST
ncbi:non-heme iron oxygenase ferredoxin subunit [Blastococcus brunescens]|uniref:Non-heme iron oxygenase ferredoxin subunit n=1 Tax=Blastococcus brunescens TaxID=1564165 RepID=A0ABZ1ATI3_9ACTN|nr:non-heme iron oxygenase ferredoxin subunit [Blastococcus sp. BMG 8361]WRL61890.1 non-heme iron oxygenase ferredoxin subunit [Blastococcus sp. BMG 8361]